MSFEYVCSKCCRRCKNAGALAMHMKKHKKKEPTSPSIMRFFKPASKKIAIEMKPIKKQPRQVKLNVKSRVEPSVTQPQRNVAVSRSNASDLNINASRPLKPPPPPRLPQSSTDVNLFAITNTIKKLGILFLDYLEELYVSWNYFLAYIIYVTMEVLCERIHFFIFCKLKKKRRSHGGILFWSFKKATQSITKSENEIYTGGDFTVAKTQG